MPLTLSDFLASNHQKSVDIWQKSADAWDLPSTRKNYDEPYCDQQVAEYRKWADDAKTRRDAAPVKIVAVYADGREETFT